MSQDFGSNPYQSPGATGGGNAAGKVAAPAIALIVTGILNVLGAIYFLFNGIFVSNVDLSANLPPGADPAQLEGMKTGLAIAGPLYIGLGIVALLCSIVVILGAVKMKGLKSYGLAMTAAVLTMIPGLSPLACCLIGLGIGIWALIVLLNADVKSAFR